MPTFSLYQKIGLVFLFLSVGMCVPNPTRNQPPLSPSSPTNHSSFPVSHLIQRSLPPHTKIQVFDTGISLMLLGFRSGEESVSFLWDTGSEISFYEGKDRLYSKEFQIGERKLQIRRGEGILPEGIQGLMGLDSFRGTCLLYDQNTIYWFIGDSPFCVHPDAYLGTQLKFLTTKQKGDHSFVLFEYPKSFVSYAHLDTGASLSILPKGEGETFLGEKRVFRPGNTILTLNHWQSKEPLTLISQSGFREEYPQVQFLTGISLENFLLSGDKDKEEVWVIGLDVLRTRPLFWDFSRKRIGIIHQEN
ncbi:hypothetical protein EHQ92_09965 [Leptospira biflexa]|uniref:hypothetical protein n=1 Tax=Leptospira biflexa TaxID=172 RepID=UPI001090F3C7|nr:hypothetical protein [Leptospira biflexa]TGM48189.1 hypothetical protein EHQ92_09965 [Leptospira biflexa]TGM49344.1 hypothetical protein EHQ88_03115 [Leptospira biflexa]TGM54612.1 hypothetical protein EHQ91_06465 [Leptospira biflexa]